MQEHQFIPKKEYKKEKGDETKTFSVNLKLDMSNIFLMYSPLMKLGMSSNQKSSKEVSERPKLTRPFAQTLPSL